MITLLSCLLNATDSVTSRILLTLLVGFLLALAPFDHVVVSALHLLFEIWLSDGVSVGDLAHNVALAMAGTLVGGLTLVTFSHSAQVKSSNR